MVKLDLLRFDANHSTETLLLRSQIHLFHTAITHFARARALSIMNMRCSANVQHLCEGNKWLTDKSMVKIIKITLYCFEQCLTACEVFSAVTRTTPSTRKGLSLRRSYTAGQGQTAHLWPKWADSPNLFQLLPPMPHLTMTCKNSRAL